MLRHRSDINNINMNTEKELETLKNEYNEIVEDKAKKSKDDEYWGCDEAQGKILQYLDKYIRYNFNKHDAEFIKISISKKYQR